MPSYVIANAPFLLPEKYNMQSYIDEISDWTQQNKMLVNEKKSNYIIFTRSKEEFSTRLSMNNVPLERLSVTKVLGVWLQEDMGWNENTKQICKKSYSRMSILSKLKYTGICTDDLITIYILFIRSLTEYCSVVFNSSLTIHQSNKIEAIQKTSLKIILDANYVSYSAALEMCGLERLSDRRNKRQLSFALKCTKNDFNKSMFQENKLSKKEKYTVNFARTEAYLNSAIPQCQRMLNSYYGRSS